MTSDQLLAYNREKQRRLRRREKALRESVDGIEGRFWPRVKKTRKCWEWTGGGTHLGYGRIVYRGQDLEAHRVSWILANGKIPLGLWVLHHCDNRPCVRPGYLFIGTIVDNGNDRDQKGRQSRGLRHSEIMRRVAARGDANGSRLCPERLTRGEDHYAARLTDKKVMTLRARHATGESIYSLAREVGMAESAVSCAIRGTSWRHVP